MNKLTLAVAATMALFGAQAFAADATPASTAADTTAAAPAKSEAKHAKTHKHHHHVKKAAQSTGSAETAPADAKK